jgi:hypothetical protein
LRKAAGDEIGMDHPGDLAIDKKAVAAPELVRLAGQQVLVHFGVSGLNAKGSPGVVRASALKPQLGLAGNCRLRRLRGLNAGRSRKLKDRCLLARLLLWRRTRKLAAILGADVAGYSRLAGADAS